MRLLIGIVFGVLAEALKVSWIAHESAQVFSTHLEDDEIVQGHSSTPHVLTDAAQKVVDLADDIFCNGT